MKFAIALVATIAAANAASLDAVASLEAESGFGDHNQSGKPNFSIDNHYRQPDYSSEYGEELPGADFNRQVYRFNEDHQIWDQNDYEERVKVEAEMLVALEALKGSVDYLNYDIHKIDQDIRHNDDRIGENREDIYENNAAIEATYINSIGVVDHAQDRCRYSQHDLD